ncbi:MAG: hypothetical protein GY759_15050 [Chloroflexi bacterium]|nr:hypothetical protein [Chloroflexota bacterium]
MPESALAKKLQIRPDSRMVILNAPKHYVELVSPLPPNVEIVPNSRTAADCVHLFVATVKEMATYVPQALACVRADGLLWISYPKRSSGVSTDIRRDKGWDILEQAGWRPVRQISIDDTWSAVRFRPKEHETVTDVIDNQYSGGKSRLRPIYDQLLLEINQLGDDIEQSPRKSYVVFKRKRPFALILPSARSRVDLGLRLPGYSPTNRLEETPNFGSGSITHKVALHSPSDVDGEVLAWLQSAYEFGG